MRVKYTKELLQPIVEPSTTMGQVIDRLGLKRAGGNYYHLKNIIKRYEISIDHFVPTTKGSGTNFGGGAKRRSLEEIFSIKPEYGPYEKGSSLKKALLESGILDVCAKCGLGPEWEGMPLVLQVDHINGKRWDDRKENLRLICPNCHSQTETFSNKNRSTRSVLE